MPNLDGTGPGGNSNKGCGKSKGTGKSLHKGGGKGNGKGKGAGLQNRPNVTAKEEVPDNSAAETVKVK